MKLTQVLLPWNRQPVRASENISPLLQERVGAANGRYLPAKTVVFAALSYSEKEIEEFVHSVASALCKELDIRNRRKGRFTELGLLKPYEIETFLTARTHLQPWALYLSETGGLGETLESAEVPYGVVPCSTMRNHGVAWDWTHGLSGETWLATSRKMGGEWDMDSDIGHESAHAAFAPVPLFAQAPDGSGRRLEDVRSIGELEPAHLARIAYLYSELAVVALRGETRETDTRLPVTRKSELFALLTSSEMLFPNEGFEKAIRTCLESDGVVDVNQGDSIFHVVTPVMRVLPGISRLVSEWHAPGVDAFVQAAGITPALTR